MLQLNEYSSIGYIDINSSLLDLRVLAYLSEKKHLYLQLIIYFFTA